MKWFMPDSSPEDRARYLDEEAMLGKALAEQCVVPGPLMAHRMRQAKEFFKHRPTLDAHGNRIDYPLSEVFPDEDWQSSHPRCCE